MAQVLTNPPTEAPQVDARGTARHIESLFRAPGWVHSDVYTSQNIFDLEMERIFHRGWLYLGHETEIPQPGDFRLRMMGRYPVIFVRGSDNVVRVLMNRCRHRGTIVCEKNSGQAQQFRCAYHGWTYDTTGKLSHVEQPGGYADLDKEKMGLIPARVDDYRGFVFASLEKSGKPLPEHLGRAMAQIDTVVDASPTGRIAVDYGAHKTKFLGNWKLVGMDGYHPNTLHASVWQIIKRGSDKPYRDPYSDDANTVTRHLDNGHVMLDLTGQRLDHLDEHLVRLASVQGGPEYIDDMRKAFGRERADLLLAIAGDPHMGIFPNLQLIGGHIRVISPVGPAETRVDMFPIRMLDVSDEINEWRLRQHEFSYGPAGYVSPDDAEIFERVQRGMSAAAEPWLDLSRGLHRQSTDADGSTVARMTDELTQRAQLEAWKSMMTDVH